jgi:hypothetical protein
VNESTSVTLWVRDQSGGEVRITNPVAVPLVPANPGIFADEGTDPREAIAYHSTSHASGVIHVDGTPKAGDALSIKIGDDAEEGGSQTYSYTVQENDTREKVRDALIAAINGAEDARVTAEPGGLYQRVVLRSKISGPDGEGLKYGATGTESTVLSPYGERLTGANRAGAPITPDNPARPGEMITVYAAGLGLVQPEEAKLNTVTGVLFVGPEFNYTNRPVDDAIVGGRTAPPIFARLKPGSVGIYEVTVLLNPDIPTNNQTEMIVAQDIYVSNIVTVPVFNPNPVE